MHKQHTLTFDRDTLKDFKAKREKATKSFVFKGNLIQVERADRLIAAFEKAFDAEPEAEMVRIPYAEDDNILFF